MAKPAKSLLERKKELIDAQDHLSEKEKKKAKEEVEKTEKIKASKKEETRKILEEEEKEFKKAAERSAAEEDFVLFKEEDFEKDEKDEKWYREFEEGLKEDYLSYADRRKQQRSDTVFDTYNTGEEWLMSEGEDDLAKGFINNFRSAIGTGVEDLAYAINDYVPWYKPAETVLKNNMAGKIEEQAQKQFKNAKASGVKGNVVDFLDAASKGLGYNIFGVNAGNYMQPLGEGFEEYRRLREQGYSREEATKRSLLNTGVSLAGDKVLEKGGDLLINRIPQRGVYGVRADFETNISPKTLRKTTVEDFFGEKKEITYIEYEEILQFKNCKYKMDIKNGVSCFPENDQLYKNIQNVKPIKYGNTGEYCFDIGIHGNPKNVAFSSAKDAPIMTPKALAVSISQNTNYKKGQPVRLLSCSTGKGIPFDDCFAQKLANEINAPVVAPTDTLFISRKGNLTIGMDNSGKMETFRPIYNSKDDVGFDWRTLNGGRRK